MGGVDFSSFGVAGEGGDVEAVGGGDVLEDALVFGLVEEGELFVLVVEVDEGLLGGGHFLGVVGGEAGAEDEGVVGFEGEVFGVLAEGVDDDVLSGFAEGIGDGFEGIAINHEEGGVLTGEVVEEGGELAGGPEGVVEEGEVFCEVVVDFRKGSGEGIGKESSGEVGIPAATGVVEFVFRLPNVEVALDGGVLISEGLGLDGSLDGGEVDVVAGGGEEFWDEFFRQHVRSLLCVFEAGVGDSLREDLGCAEEN